MFPVSNNRKIRKSEKKGGAETGLGTNPLHNPEPKFRVIAGLGNPGKEYEKTYHNAGFLALEYIVRGTGKKWKKGTDKWEYLKNKESVFVRPLTFMNNSGEAIKNALVYFGAKPQDLLLIHDDSDLPLGKFKLTFGRGSAGHRGVESVQKALKTKEFSRLRLGIRRSEKIKAGEFVLKNMSDADIKKIYSAVDGTKLKVKEN